MFLQLHFSNCLSIQNTVLLSLICISIIIMLLLLLFIYLQLSQSTQSAAGLNALKHAANGRY